MTTRDQLLGVWNGSSMLDLSTGSYDVLVFHADGTGFLDLYDAEYRFSELFDWEFHDGDLHLAGTRIKHPHVGPRGVADLPSALSAPQPGEHPRRRPAPHGPALAGHVGALPVLPPRPPDARHLSARAASSAPTRPATAPSAARPLRLPRRAARLPRLPRQRPAEGLLRGLLLPHGDGPRHRPRLRRQRQRRRPRLVAAHRPPRFGGEAEAEECIGSCTASSTASRGYAACAG